MNLRTYKGVIKIQVIMQTQNRVEPTATIPFWKIVNSSDKTKESADILIYGDISNYDFWEEDVTPKKFSDDLKELGNVKTINLRINSNGGSVFASYAIMNMLKRHPATVITYIDGIAASAASILAMAGDKIIMPIGSMMMIHNPLTSIWGSYYATELRKMADTLDTIKETIIDIYQQRVNIDRDKLIEFLDEETYFTPQEALKYGFADEILDMAVEAKLDFSSNNPTAIFNGQKFNISSLNLDNLKSKFETMQKSNPNSIKFEPYKLDIKNKSNLICHTTNQNKEEIIMDLNELKEKYPDIYKEAKDEGVLEGIACERKRIKEIEEISPTNTGELTNKAKFETGIDAKEFAVQLLKEQKQKGTKYLEEEKQDALQIDSVPNASDINNNSEYEKVKEEELKQRTINEIKKLRD